MSSVLPRLRFLVWASSLATGLAGFALAASAPPVAEIVVIPIHHTVDEGMAHMVQAWVARARAEGAQAIVLDIDSPGGLISPALNMRDALLASKVPVYAYVSERAYSAAALVALSARRIEMAPGSSIGDAQPIPNTPKLVSGLAAEFKSTALRYHRDPQVAAAMVVTPLTLDTNEAVRAKIADGVQPSLRAFERGAFGAAPVETAKYTLGERVARFATDPAVSGILLTIGMLGLLIEMLTLHGVAGFVGVAALALFFGSHVYAGFSNGLVVVLAIAGLIGIVYELHVVPGHGIPGVLGSIALVLAAILAFNVVFFFVALQTISTAIVLTVLLFWLATRMWPENAWLRRLTFAGVQGPEYVASADHSALRGCVGSASSLLRPAGVATFDGNRVDVLTEGDFIPAGTPVRVTRVEGARVFVEPVTLPSYKE